MVDIFLHPCYCCGNATHKPCSSPPMPQGGTLLNTQNQEHPLQRPQTNSRGEVEPRPVVLPLAAINATLLPLVGGKAANLGELIHAGLPVPDGFCITTAAYEQASQQAGLEPILNE